MEIKLKIGKETYNEIKTKKICVKDYICKIEIGGRKYDCLYNNEGIIADSFVPNCDNDLENMNNKEHYFGRTKFDMQIIWIDKDIPVDLKKKTLYHELLHCYRGCYIGFCELNQCDEDFWCDLSANSHDIIHKIVEDYFKEK